MSFVIYAVILFAIYLVAYMFVKRKLNIKVTDNGFMYKHVNKAHRWLEIFIVVIAIIAYIISPEDLDSKFHIPFTGFALMFACRSFMEWKHRRETKEYILSAMTALYFIFIQLGNF